jgi:hypothetical protein
MCLTVRQSAILGRSLREKGGDVMKAKYFVVMVAIATMAGCSAGDNSSAEAAGTPANVDAYCEAVCAKEHECDNTVDQSTCANSCENGNAATESKMRGEYVSKLQACLLGLDCATVLNGTAYETCRSEARAVLAPTPAGTALCEAWVNTAAQCGETVNKVNCLEAATVFNDISLNEARNCTMNACPEIRGCITAALGV